MAASEVSLARANGAGRYREGVAAGALHDTFDYVFAFTPPKPVRVTLYFSKATGTGWVFVRG